MKALGGTLALLVLVASLGGCLNQAPGGNPNLRTPRVLVDRTPDHRTIVYVHGAFSSDNLYERITVRMNNATTAEEPYVYALTDKTNLTRFLLNVTVEDAPNVFSFQVGLVLHPGSKRVQVTPWTAGGPGHTGNQTLPYQHIVPLVKQKQGGS